MTIFASRMARYHTARSLTEYLSEVGVGVLPWPAHSPDLHPIKHIWHSLKRRVRARIPAPTTLRELKAAMVEE